MNYPHFITDKPEGKDLFVGQSQNRIANNIVQFITENEEILLVKFGTTQTNQKMQPTGNEQDYKS